MQTVPLEIYQGEDLFLPMQWQFCLLGKYYPIDISGYVFEMQFRQTVNSSIILADSSSINGQIIVDGPNGKANIYVKNTVTATWPLGTIYYDLKSTNAVGLVERLFGGPCCVKEMVTR